MLPEWLKLGLFFAGYIVLMRWILPALGIPTCMSGACRIPEPSNPVSGSPVSETRPHDPAPMRENQASDHR